MQSRHVVFIALIALAVPGTASASAIGRGERGERARTTGARDMARLPAGTYRPLYTMPGEVEVRVAAFALDRRAVTRGEFLAAVASATRRDATDDLRFRRALLKVYAARSPARLPIAGSGAANVYGVRDLHGSAWEWTRDFNSSHRLYCASGAIGAADPTNYPAFMRSALRAALTPRSTMDGLGFRCAGDLPA